MFLLKHKNKVYKIYSFIDLINYTYSYSGCSCNIFSTFDTMYWLHELLSTTSSYPVVHQELHWRI